MYEISPCAVVTTKTITSFKIDRIEISLFKSAIITVILQDSAGSIIDVKFLNMVGEDYSKWDADDSYVIEFIKQNLGFSSPVINTVVEPSADPVVEPSSDPVVEPSSDPVVDPVVEPSSNPVVEPVVEPSADPSLSP
jgi:hypothetical protein